MRNKIQKECVNIYRKAKLGYVYEVNVMPIYNAIVIDIQFHNYEEGINIACLNDNIDDVINRYIRNK